MHRVAQFGITLGALGVVLTLMGLFPGMTGLRPASGIGPMQIFAILGGFTLLIVGALIYVKFTFYPFQAANLVQQIGYRLGFTGILFAYTTGMADILGFGSHQLSEPSGVVFGTLQAIGVMGGFLIAAFGVMLYAVMGQPDGDSKDS
jgi:hypothetical protein